ncbi:MULTISPECIES: hypothetical protein [unclassified Mucilaginibacter]|uniref:hypothetical protein n=1 Tax=unclassified Mucilaginibacter TaxID=2617802 RepID=UPI00095B96AF|nr:MULTISPECIES: hypothetical protein [unclassified Mucilaginibacter]HEK20266.1 hypothetical protein [Bacteroidota bacterium]OJW13561.1 MAG: hypothetical protein BGO48_02080 [Mucilaginibacter sp. 44-25]PAW95017.1 hypothetical protein CKK33_16540 [Mucilaginibacter sp. MD40]PLW90721.1 MAG: hypothetical protein C0154_04845 [Mucilaginibacter sp.]PMP64834.1 MAG: hypothetical protein C0191_05160 [Mucilaginibacter sp.]
MAKVTLTKAELAALDAIIAELKGDKETVEADVTALGTTAIIRTAIQVTKVATKATPYVTDATEVLTAILGRGANDEVAKELHGVAKEGLSLDELIELRKKFK